jgi:hypothetical protein
LVDLLLLGGAEGKPERQGGQVVRRVQLGTPAEARRVWRDLARELCEVHGVEWRKRFIEGKSRYEIERAHLVVDGSTVELAIDVPDAVWSLFQ